MIGATKRQQQILEFITSYTSMNGYPPTYKEIAVEFGFASHNAVQSHIDALVEKGMVTHRPGQARTLRVVS